MGLPTGVTRKTYTANSDTRPTKHQLGSWEKSRAVCRAAGGSFTHVLTGSELCLQNEQTPETEQRKDIYLSIKTG